MRTSYTGNWYNDDDQLVTSVNYGTNGGTAMSARPDDAPSRSTTPGAPEVTSYTYTPEGYTDTTTDPRGIVTKNYYDEQGNVTKTIDNYQGDGTPSADEPDVNQTTEDTYNSDNQLVDQTAVDPGSVNQTTENEYGPSGADNDNSLLLDVEYPDPNTGDPSSANEVKYTYNSDGTVATMTDRDGTVHAYSYDCDGNQIADVITTLGAGVDGTVTQRDTDYNDLGQPVAYETKNAAGTVLSEVDETYNGDGDITAEAQSHNGAATDDTPTVGYGYQDTSGGQDQQTSLTYPDGRKIAYTYGATGSVTDADGLVASIADTNFSDGVVVTSGGSQDLADFTYMGDGTLVGQYRPETEASEAITLDNFGDVADLNWTNTAGASTDHFGLGYDADGNVMYEQNYVDSADSELFHANGATPGYDGLNRLTTFSRGTLSASVDGGTLDTVASPSFTQSWTLDAVGNQTAVTTNGTEQDKTQNGQNQTTSVTTGGTTNDLAYDGNGATTTDEDGREWTYDAWGDPVSVANSDGEPMETEAYDALGRRITDTTYSGGSPTTSDIYYSTSGQVLETDQAGSPISQTVYSAGYVNSIIEVDQATGSPGTLNRRLYVQQDANYNVTSVTDTSGTVLERYIYSPYGEQTVLNPDGSVKGDGTPASSSYNLPQGYQGMLFDPVTSDNLTPNRVYDPMLATWLSQDPSGASGSGDDLYGFAVDNPASNADASGLAATRITAGSSAFQDAPAAAPAPVTLNSIAAPATVTYPDFISVPKSMFVPNYCVGVPDTSVSVPALSSTYAGNFLQLCDIPQMPQMDDGTGTPGPFAFMEMATDAALFHSMSQGVHVDIPGVYLRINGSGRTFPGAQYDGYRQGAQIAGAGMQAAAMEVLGLGAGKFFEYLGDAGEFDAAISGSLSLSSPGLGAPVFESPSLSLGGTQLPAAGLLSAGASDTGGALSEGAFAGVETNESAFRAMSEKEFARVEAGNGLAMRPRGQNELGVTLNRDYVSGLLSRNPRNYSVVAEFQVTPGTWQGLLDRGAVHPSAAYLFPNKAIFESGMQVPQIKLESGGVLSILLGESQDGVDYFNQNVLNIVRH